MRKKEESVEAFILRFETAEASLKCCNIELSSLNLAIHLIETLNVTESQKRNIISQVKFEDNPNVYEDVKKAIKLLEGSLVVKDKKEKAADEEAMYKNSKGFHKENRERGRFDSDSRKGRNEMEDIEKTITDFKKS